VDPPRHKATRCKLAMKILRAVSVSTIAPSDAALLFWPALESLRYEFGPTMPCVTRVLRLYGLKDLEALIVT
jgi:hypothetical protein